MSLVNATLECKVHIIKLARYMIIRYICIYVQWLSHWNFNFGLACSGRYVIICKQGEKLHAPIVALVTIYRAISLYVLVSTKVRNYICSLASSFTDSQILIKIDQTEFCLKYDVEDMKVESAFAFSSIFRKPMNWTCQLMPGWHFPYSPTQQEKNLRNIRTCKL